MTTFQLSQEIRNEKVNQRLSACTRNDALQTKIEKSYTRHQYRIYDCDLECLINGDIVRNVTYHHVVTVGIKTDSANNVSAI